MKHLMIFGAGLAALGLSAPALAQETTGEAVEALYDVISGPVGEVRTIAIAHTRSHAMIRS